MRRRTRNFVNIIHRKITLALIRDCRKMKRHICGTADCHTEPQRIVQTFSCHNLPCRQLFPDHFHNPASGRLRIPKTLRQNRRYHGTAGQCHPHGLRNRTHGICRSQKRTGTAAGTAPVFQRLIFLLRNLPGLKHAERLHRAGIIGLPAVKQNASQHGSPIADNGGNIKTSRRHQKTGNHFVAGTQKHDPVKIIQFSHRLYFIRYQAAGRKNETHTVIAASHTVAGSDNAKLHRCAAGLQNTLPHKLRHLTQVVMSRIRIVPCIRNSDQRPLQIIIAETHPFVERAHTGPFMAV